MEEEFKNPHSKEDINMFKKEIQSRIDYLTMNSIITDKEIVSMLEELVKSLKYKIEMESITNEKK